MAIKSPAQLTPEECERRLIEATEQFMRGDISVEAFEEAERRYMPDYRSALITLAKRSRIGREQRERPLKQFARDQAKRLVAY